MADSTGSQPSFFARLKQHHLYGGVVVYAIIAGFLIQLASRALPAFGWGGALPAVIIILLAGFPVAVALSWTLVKPKEPAKYTRWQKLHWKLNASVSVVVIVAAVISSLYAWRLDQRHAARLATERALAQATAHPAIPTFNPPADTLVVLPFTNLSGDPKQQYFSDGITEELTGELGQNAALTVIAWDTASHYRDSVDTPTAIGKALNVANLLHGSIEREGSEVRVIAELVDTRTGAQVWSAHYDDTLANVFQVQDQITAAIAQALKVKFASLGVAPTVNPEAHDLVLQARALMDKARTAAPIEKARHLLEQAVALDPDYADAHAVLAGAWYNLTNFTTLSLKDALPKVRKESGEALALDPHNVIALVGLGNADISSNHIVKAKAEFERALTIDPSYAIAHMAYANLLPLKPGLAQALEGVQLDPDNATGQNNLAEDYLDLGDYQQSLAPAQAVIRLAPHNVDSAFGLAETYALLNRNKNAVEAFDLVQPNTPLGKALVVAGRLAYQSVLDPNLHTQALAAVNALRRRSDLDPLSMADVLQLYVVLDEKGTALGLLTKYCADAPVGCSDLSVNPTWLPLHGNSRFEKLVKQYDTVSNPATSVSASGTQP